MKKKNVYFRTEDMERRGEEEEREREEEEEEEEEGI
jgi:hypothetical protein